MLNKKYIANYTKKFIKLINEKKTTTRERKKQMEKIVLFDTKQGTQNLGDYIIMEAILKEMNYVLKNKFVTHFSTHTPIARFYQNFNNNVVRRACDSAKYKFVCGTNIIKYSLKVLSPDFNINIFNIPYYKDSICIGVGCGVNAKKTDLYTKNIYRHILSKDYVHSVRDERTKEFLESIGVKAINTGCPTLWGFTEEKCKKIPTKKAENVIFTLTSYKKNPKEDQMLIDILKKNYKKVYFWVQGSEDMEYFESLSNTDEIEIVNPTLESFKEKLQEKSIEYVGTRLHAGICAMQNNKRSIILAIDNRSKDMFKTYNLNIVDINNINELEEKINSEFTTNIVVDFEKINNWKKQFK